MIGGLYDVGKMVATLGLNTAPFMAGAQGAMATMQRMSTGMMMMGRAMTRFVTLPMAIAGGASIKMQADFETSLTKIIGLVGVARGTVEDWGDEVKKMAIRTGRAPEELADALFFVASAGIRGSEALDVLEMSAQAAAAGLGETKVVADLATSAMNAYKNSNLTASQAVDVVVAAVREGKAPADALAASMGKVLPIASAFKVSFNEVGAAFAAMTRTGTSADMAATQLKAILSQMASPSMQAADAMARYGYSAEAFKKTIREEGLITALLELNTAIHNNQSTMSEVFPNIRALMGVLDLLGDNVQSNIEIFKALEKSGGSLSRAFAEVANTTQQKLNVAAAALKVLAIDIGEAISGPLVKALTGLIEKVETAIGWFGQFNDAQKMAILRMAGFTAVLGPALVLLSRFIMIMSSNPLIPLIGGIALAATAIKGFRNVAMEASGEMQAMNAVSREAEAAFSAQKAKVKALYDVARDESKQLGERKKALQELNRISPEYFGNLSTETINTKNAEIALRNYNNEMILRAKIQAASNMLVKLEQERLELINQTAEESLPLWKKWGYALWEGATALALSGAHLEKGILAQEDYRNQVRLINEKIKALNEYLQTGNQELLNRVWLQEQVNEATDDGTKAAQEQGGYLYSLMKQMEMVQGEILGASYENLAAKQDELRNLELLYNEATMLSDMYGDMGKAQAAMELIQQRLVFLSGRELQDALSQLKVYQDQLRTIELMEGGIGAIEASAEGLRKVQEDINNASADQLATLKETAYYMALQHELLTKAHNPLEEELVLAKRNSMAWLEGRKNRIAQIEKEMKIMEFFHLKEHDLYKQLAQEKFDIEQKLRDQRKEDIIGVMDAANQAISAVQNLLQNQMNAELQAAGKNKRKREQIEKEFLEKQKKWAIAQALINTAIGVTKAFGQLGPIAGPIAAAFVTAAGAIQIAAIKAQSFAQGGIVYGETIAKVADYPNAKSNPEVIAPLSDLKKLLMKDSDFSNIPAVIELRGKGSELYSVIEMEKLLRRTY